MKPTWAANNLWKGMIAVSNKLKLGQVVSTKRVWDLVECDERFRRFTGVCVARFLLHDWDDLCDEDWELNDNYARKKGGRILASYKLPDYADADGEDSLWIILDKDASATTLLFPGDY